MAKLAVVPAILSRNDQRLFTSPAPLSGISSQLLRDGSGGTGISLRPKVLGSDS